MSGNTRLVLTTGETRDAERRAIAAGISGVTLMERAGDAVASVCRSFGAARSAAVLCGPGNNGGDGFVVARRLAEAGWRVVAFALDDRGEWQGDAGQARARWDGALRPASTFEPEAFDLIVDALFGAGLARPLAGSAADLVARLEGCGRPVVSVDMPSGVDGTTGAIHGAAVQATVTVTFGTAKPGHYLYPGRGRRGRLTVADIGVEAPGGTETVVNAPGWWQAHYPRPRVDGHKYGRGHAVVVSGGAWQTGAARLAARAALRIGAGLVTLAAPRDALAVNAAHLTAVMLCEADGPAGLGAVLADERRNGIILGPGLGVGSKTRDLVAVALAPQPSRSAVARPRACLLDADALTSFSGEAGSLARLIASAPGPVVVTPHAGEFARLFSEDPAVLVGSKLDRTRAAARLLGCVVLLKGADTVIAGPDGRAVMTDADAPWLATAGSGDVLSGLIGGLLTQGMPPLEAAAAGDHLHGAAARLFGPGLIAEDLPDLLPSALRGLDAVLGLSGDPR